MSIFVSLASYRDNSCSNTLNSLFENADKPFNVFVGICQQNDINDPDCLFQNKLYEHNIRVIKLPYTEAKGPTYARYICSTLWDGEDYYLQIDSHTTFVKGWDTKCISMIKRIKDEGLSNKPVISHYSLEHTDYKNYENYEKDKYNVPRICKSFFNHRKIISFRGAEIINTNNKLIKTPYISGHMFFCESYFLNELPFDPYLPYLFTGEEILLSVRFFTNGWDAFVPSENILYHEYIRDDKPKVWNDLSFVYDDSNAVAKVKYYLGIINKEDVHHSIQDDIDKYGLGSIRTLSDYYNYAKIDLENIRVLSNFCKNNNEASIEDIMESQEVKEDYLLEFDLGCRDKYCRRKSYIIGIIIVLTVVAVLIFLFLLLFL